MLMYEIFPTIIGRIEEIRKFNTCYIFNRIHTFNIFFQLQFNFIMRPVSLAPALVFDMPRARQFLENKQVRIYICSSK